MTDLELYAILEDKCSEVHDDGMCFVDRWNYSDFVEKLGHIDSEYAIPAHITTDGAICFNVLSLEYYCNDIEAVAKQLIKHFND